MPVPITDYHKIIRDAAASTVNAQAFGVPVVTADDLDGIMKITSIPAIALTCIGPEINESRLTTNAQDGLGLSVAVMLLAVGVDNGAKSPIILDMTTFRRAIRSLFNNRRLFNYAVAPAAQILEVSWCATSDSGPLIDPRSQEFQRISTSLIITAFGRFPRS